MLAAANAWAAEPLVGMWQMIDQWVEKEQVQPSPVAIKIQQTEQGLNFSYLKGREMAPIMQFTVKIDGPEGVIRNPEGGIIGWAKLGKAADGSYKLTMRKPNREAEEGEMKITDQGKVLKSRTKAVIPGEGVKQLVQVFARQ